MKNQCSVFKLHELSSTICEMQCYWSICDVLSKLTRKFENYLHETRSAITQYCNTQTTDLQYPACSFVYCFHVIAVGNKATNG